MSTEEASPKSPSRGVMIFLWLLPLWLVISTTVGLWIHFRAKAEAAKIEQARMATAVSESGLQGDMEKFVRYLGERHTGTPEAEQALAAAATMIESSLGPSNAGYAVERLLVEGSTETRWPVLVVTLRGTDPAADPLWVVAAYDTRPGSPGAEANASGVSSVMAAASALATTPVRRTVGFAFLPHGYDVESPVVAGLTRLTGRIGKAAAVLQVEAMGAADSLLVTTRDAESPVLDSITGLGEVAGAEEVCLQEDGGLSAAMTEVGLPVVRVATRPQITADEADATAPDPAVHAAATRSLVNLVKRLAGS